MRVARGEDEPLATYGVDEWRPNSPLSTQIYAGTARLRASPSAGAPRMLARPECGQSPNTGTARCGHSIAWVFGNGGNWTHGLDAWGNEKSLVFMGLRGGWGGAKLDARCNIADRAESDEWGR